MNPECLAKILARGTPLDPIRLTHEEYAEIIAWRSSKDSKLESLPEEEQEEFIKECRREAVKRWPWWYPYVHVSIAG